MKVIPYVIAGYMTMWSFVGLYYWSMHPELTQMQVFLWMI